MLKWFFTNYIELGCKSEAQITIWQKQSLLIGISSPEGLGPTDEQLQNCKYWHNRKYYYILVLCILSLVLFGLLKFFSDYMLSIPHKENSAWVVIILQEFRITGKSLDLHSKK